jgi:hypothetical protein
MLRRPVKPLLSLLLLLAACDGGLRVDRQGNPCEDTLATVRVEVVDARGAPVQGATVTAMHVETGHTLTTTTGERGLTTAVNESLGPGLVRLEATAGSKTSPPAEMTWRCDACHCTPEPASVRLQLHP